MRFGEVPLLTHAIGFGEPSGDFGIDLVRACESEGVKMVSRRKSFDATEARIFQASRENDVAVHPVLPDDEGGETHSHLKSDARFLGQHYHRAIFFRESQQLVEDRANTLRLAGEVRREWVRSRTGVRLIAVGKLPAATWTTP